MHRRMAISCRGIVNGECSRRKSARKPWNPTYRKSRNAGHSGYFFGDARRAAELAAGCPILNFVFFAKFRVGMLLAAGSWGLRLGLCFAFALEIERHGCAD